MSNHTSHDSISSQLRYQVIDIIPPNIEVLSNKSVSRLQELERATKAPAVSRNDMMKKNKIFNPNNSTKEYIQDRNMLDMNALYSPRPVIKTNLTKKDLYIPNGRSTQGIIDYRKPLVNDGKKMVDTNVYFNRY